MRSVFKEYKRLKKLAQVTDGQLGSEAMGSFLEKVDEEVLAKIKVSDKDRSKLKNANPESQMKILSSYFEKFLQRGVEEKINSKIQMSDKLVQVIARKARAKSGKIILPHQALLMLARLNPSALLVLENSKKVFIYPLAKLKQILMELDQAEVVWEQDNNILKILSAEGKGKFACVLFAQEPYALNDKPRFVVKIPDTRDVSITDILFKVAEALISK